MNIMLGGTVTTLPESLRGPFEDFSQKVNSTDGVEWEGAFKKFLRKEPCWVNGEAKSVAPAEPKSLSILKLVTTVTLPARAEKFVPKKAFVENTKPGAHVKFAWVDPDFIRWFGNKTEEPTAEATLRQHILTRPSVFAPAMKEIRDGGVATKTTPGELYSLLEKQSDGPKSDAGPLLTNGYANLFEMDDVNGVARLVNAGWYGGRGGWDVYADDASDSGQWRDGHQVFSRDSR